MAEAYPELRQRQSYIYQVVESEESKFRETLSTGLELLDGIMNRSSSEVKDRISGEDAFKLYDTYGFPVELTKEFANERGFSVDTDGRTDELTGWFSECGVNLIGPNEVQAGNDIRAYRRRFGRTMAYDGGLDKLTLTKGRDAIDAMLEDYIPFMKQTGGGWIVCVDHRVVQGTPLSDFQYYVDRVREMVRF